MKILVLHNSYKQLGGEDVIVQREIALLCNAGNRVLTFFRHNREIDDRSFLVKIKTARNAIWARNSYRDVLALLLREKPDVAHFHNTTPLISPSAYYACLSAAVPVVQTLHNYRLFCPAGSLFRDGRVCEECLEHTLWRGVEHGCYRESRSATATVALTLAIHRKWAKWTETVDCFIAPTEFARAKFVTAGLSPDKVFVKPNFVDPDSGKRNSPGEYVVFVGRLTPEKGLRTLIAAWACLRRPIPLVIVGDGLLCGELERAAIQLGMSHIKFEGSLPNAMTLRTMRGARFLVFPSECYETFGLTIAEAFACGTPVICSRLGAMLELVADGRTGLHFTTGDPEDLAAKVEWAWAHTSRMAEMGRAAQAEYEAKYRAERNYRLLMEIYERAIQFRKAA